MQKTSLGSLQSLTRPESLLTSQEWSAKGPPPRGAEVPGGEGTGLQGQGFCSHPGCSLEAVKDAPHPPGKEMTLGRWVPGGDLRKNISKEKERVWGFLEAGRQGSRDGGWGGWIPGKARARSSVGTRAPSARTGDTCECSQSRPPAGPAARGPGSLPTARGGPGPAAPNQSSRESAAHRPPHRALGPPARRALSCGGPATLTPAASGWDRAFPGRSTPPGPQSPVQQAHRQPLRARVAAGPLPHGFRVPGSCPRCPGTPASPSPQWVAPNC